MPPDENLVEVIKWMEEVSPQTSAQRLPSPAEKDLSLIHIFWGASRGKIGAGAETTVSFFLTAGSPVPAGSAWPLRVPERFQSRRFLSNFSLLMLML